jgi:hypothetical protein
MKMGERVQLIQSCYARVAAGIKHLAIPPPRAARRRGSTAGVPLRAVRGHAAPGPGVWRYAGLGMSWIEVSGSRLAALKTGVRHCPVPGTRR